MSTLHGVYSHFRPRFSSPGMATKKQIADIDATCFEDVTDNMVFWWLHVFFVLCFFFPVHSQKCLLHLAIRYYLTLVVSTFSIFVFLFQLWRCVSKQKKKRSPGFSRWGVWSAPKSRRIGSCGLDPSGAVLLPGGCWNWNCGFHLTKIYKNNKT